MEAQAAASQEQRAASASSSPQGFAGRCSRPEVVTAEFQQAYADLVSAWPSAAQLPFVYSTGYNITFGGLEKLHPFDSAKFRKVVQQLIKRGLLTDKAIVTPLEATREVLGDVHDQDYLHKIHTSSVTVAQVTELGLLALLPNWLLQWRVVTPMKRHVGGTMLATALAVERGFAINIGGGMHHAHHAGGAGWCPFDDVTLAIRRLRRASGGRIQRVTYVDVDAHQGNGVERDKIKFADDQLVVVDLFTSQIYPNDTEAMAGISVKVPLARGTSDAEYLQQLDLALAEAEALQPDAQLIFYNAGTDILTGDPLGQLDVSPAGVLQRDEAVWRWALRRGVPIVMCLSGGYARDSAQVIADSIANLLRKLVC